MLFRFRRFYYYQVRELVENKDKKQYRIKHGLEFAVSTVQMFRFIICTICVFVNSFEYWKYDPLCYFIVEISGELKRIYLMVASMAVIILIESKLCFFMIKENVPFNILHDIVVNNMDYISHCALPKKEQALLFNNLYQKNLNNLIKHSFIFKWLVPSFILKLYSWLLTKYEFFTKLNFIDLKKLSFLYKEPLTDEFSKLKAKLYFTSWLVDGFYNLIQVPFGKLFYLFYFNHFNDYFFTIGLICFSITFKYCELTFQIFDMNNWFKLLIFIDSVMFSMNFFNIFQLSTFVSAFIYMESVHRISVWKSVTNRLRKIESFLFITKQKKKHFFCKSNFILQKIFQIYFDYFKMIKYITMLYPVYWSNPLYLFIIISIPLNVTANMALFKNLKLTDLIIVNSLVISTSLVTLTIFSIMAKETNEIQRPRRYLYKIIPWIDGNRKLYLKLLLEEWFHKISFGKRYGPRISTIGTVTRSLMYRVKFIRKRETIN